MTDKNDALFLVRLPFGQKTIPYEEVPELIAMAKSPGYDIEKASGDEDVIFVLEVGLEERQLRAAVQAGEVEVLSKSLHRMEPPFMGRLENTLLTVRALREYVESIHGFLEVQDAPEQADTQPQTAPVVEAPDSETPEQRRARWLDWYGKGERGAVRRVYERERLLNPKADRAYIGKQIKIAKAELADKKRGGAWVSQLVQDGKR